MACCIIPILRGQFLKMVAKDILILSSLATMQLVQAQYNTPGLFSISDYLNEDSKDCDDYEDDSV